MNINEILKMCDHTLLSATATWEQIATICDDAAKYKTASVCIPPSFVARAKMHLDSLRPSGEAPALCTVIGFPLGYNTPAAKVFETADAVSNGADEIDMVMNQGVVKDGDFDALYVEIKAVRAACAGCILKIIIETCNLDGSEKEQVTRVVAAAGADYIKTSTGFGSGGATVADVALFKRFAPGLKIKAAGGIGSVADAEALVAAGASRLGTSRIVAAVKKEYRAENVKTY